MKKKNYSTRVDFVKKMKKISGHTTHESLNSIYDSLMRFFSSS